MTTQTLAQTMSFQKALAIKMPKVNWKAFVLLSFFLALCLSVFYIFQLTQLVRGSYLLQSYQKIMSNLVQEGNNLDISAAKISYLENIQQKTQDLNFEKVQSIKYIEVLDSSLAKK